MNRAVRRQQTKEPKEKPGRARAMPGVGTSSKTAKGAAAPKGRSGITPRFATDIISELRKVVWPKREDVWRLTIVIVIVTVIIGATLGLIDFGFSKLIDETLLN
jgi:preprotein translocase subunit SecE